MTAERGENPTGSVAADDAALREFLGSRDVPCPLCGYNLRGLTGTMCPECARELRLSVGLVEPRMGAWIAAVVMSAAGAGFSLLLIGYVLIRIGFGRGGGLPPNFLTAVATGLFLQLPWTIGLVVQRRRFNRASTPVQLGLAVLSLVLTIVNVLIFSYFAR
jgi:hypothetical protein